MDRKPKRRNRLSKFELNNPNQNAAVASASRKLVQMLRFLRPKSCSEDILCRLISIFFSVDVKLSQAILEWYAPNAGDSAIVEKGRRYISKLIRKLTVPLIFHVLDEAVGICVAHLHSLPSVNRSPAGIIVSTVPFVSSNSILDCQQLKSHPSNESQHRSPMIAATVQLGDLVLLRGVREDWYVVHELNSERDTIILRRASEIDMLPGLRELADNKIDEPRVDTRRCGEYDIREVCRIHLIGCLVWRRCATDDKDKSGYSRYSEEKENDKQEIIFSLPCPKLSQAIVDMQTLVNNYQREQFLMANDDDSDEQVKAQAGRLDWGISEDSKPANVHRTRRAEEKRVRQTKHPLQQMQSEAVVRMWLKNKELQQRLKELFIGEERINSCCAADRTWWLKICRSLKSICKGGEDLLPLFESWTRSFLESDVCDGLELNCQLAWKSCRPHTNCDDTVLAKARIYFQSQGIKSDRIKIDPTNGKVLVEHCRLTPTLCSVLSSIEELINDNCALEFVGIADDLQASEHRNECQQPSSTVIIVPSAQFEIDLPNDDKPVQLSSSTSSMGTFVCSDSCSAEIHVGDILMDPHFLYHQHNNITHGRTDQFEREQQRGYGWYSQFGHRSSLSSITKDLQKEKDHYIKQSSNTKRATTSIQEEADDKFSDVGTGSEYYVVLRVDLLFARVFIQPCESFPVCWLPNRGLASSSSDPQDDQFDYNTFGNPFWIPVSVLWDVAVLRPISTSQSRLSSNFGSLTPSLKMQYRMFLTPVQDTDDSLRFLQSLPRESPIDKQHRALEKNKKSVERIADSIVKMCMIRLFCQSKPTGNTSSAQLPVQQLPTITASLVSITGNAIQIGWCIGLEYNSNLPTLDTGLSGAVALHEINKASLRCKANAAINDQKVQSINPNKIKGKCRNYLKQQERTERDSKSKTSLVRSSEDAGTVNIYLMCVDIKVEANICRPLNSTEHSTSILPYYWKCVYRGVGNACSVQGLCSLTGYSFRLRFVRSAAREPNGISHPFRELTAEDADDANNDIDIAHAHLMAFTVNEPLPSGPRVLSRFEPTATKNHARCRVSAVHSTEELPSGCCYLIEGAINPNYIPAHLQPKSEKSANEEIFVDFDSLHWTPLAKGACPTQWIGGEVCGKQLILATSVINQDGRRGPRSATFTVCDVPEFSI